jgi:hypothetical protein
MSPNNHETGIYILPLFNIYKHMASKMKCPQCKRMLKEAGDEGKVARGEYLVHHDPAFKWKWDIECMPCGFRADPSGWWDEDENGPRPK